MSWSARIGITTFDRARARGYFLREEDEMESEYGRTPLGRGSFDKQSRAVSVCAAL